jgi:hypothetical protein
VTEASGALVDGKVELSPDDEEPTTNPLVLLSTLVDWKGELNPNDEAGTDEKPGTKLTAGVAEVRGPLIDEEGEFDPNDEIGTVENPGTDPLVLLPALVMLFVDPKLEGDT